METQEALKACVQLRNSVQDKVSDLLARGVVATDTVIDSIFLACDELLRVELLALGASVNFINGCGSQVCDHCPGHVSASTCLTKEGVEGILSSNGLAHQARCHVLGSSSPSRRYCLDSSLAIVDGDALRHGSHG